MANNPHRSPYKYDEDEFTARLRELTGRRYKGIFKDVTTYNQPKVEPYRSAMCVGGPMAGKTIRSRADRHQVYLTKNEEGTPDKFTYVFTRVIRGAIEFDAWVPENAGSIEKERGKWAIEHILAFYENTVGEN